MGIIACTLCRPLKHCFDSSAFVAVIHVCVRVGMCVLVCVVHVRAFSFGTVLLFNCCFPLFFSSPPFPFFSPLSRFAFLHGKVPVGFFASMSKRAISLHPRCFFSLNCRCCKSSVTSSPCPRVGDCQVFARTGVGVYCKIIVIEVRLAYLLGYCGN